MAKRAVLIGCNYPGTKAELRGCINDVWKMHKCLIHRYGFSKNNITVLIDTDHSYTQPTGKNIRSAMSRLVRSAKPGDVLFVHYSGHGTRLPAETGEDDNTGYDECIVPTDMNLITDEDFREYVEKVPRGCKITIVSDSCHSGGLIEDAKEQIGESTKDGGSGFDFKKFLYSFVEDTIESRDMDIPSETQVELNHGDYNYVKNRSLSLSTLIDILKQKTGKDDIDIGKLRPTLFNIFGEDASPKVKKFMNYVLGVVNNLAQELLKHNLNGNDEEELESPVVKARMENVQKGILLSGCQTDQTSADASPNGNPEEAYGAFSNAIQAILEETDGVISNGELVLKARKKLKWQGYTQKPGLYCSDDHVDAPFVC